MFTLTMSYAESSALLCASLFKELALGVGSTEVDAGGSVALDVDGRVLVERD